MIKKLSILLVTIILLWSCKREDVKLEDEYSEIPLQSETECAFQEVRALEIARNPNILNHYAELERKTKLYKGRSRQNNYRFAGTLYVSVVLHIVHTNPDIITNQQIQTQIVGINRDFKKANAELTNTNVYLAGYNYNLVANCDIQFVLSKVIRKKTSVTSFGINDDPVKKSSKGGSDPVDPETKLNVWVCDLQGNKAGYAYTPPQIPALDGIVIDHQAFGTVSTGYSLFPSRNLGRSLTHEIGHWLNLEHIWGDAHCGDDFVDDTPLHDDKNKGCPATNLRSKCIGKPFTQWMNFMDYSNDGCLYMFTDGQKSRVDAAIEYARSQYFSLTPEKSIYNSGALWSFDDCTAKDLSGNDQHGSFNGGNPDCSLGISSRSSCFSNSNFWDFRSQYNLNINKSSFSISYWVKFSTGDIFNQFGSNPFFNLQSGDPNSFKHIFFYNRFDPFAPGQTYWAISTYQVNVGFVDLYTNANYSGLTDGNWHHFALTCTGGNVALYLDGEHLGSFLSPSTNYNAVLANADGQKNVCFDQARYYSFSLSETQIQEIFNNKL